MKNFQTIKLNLLHEERGRDIDMKLLSKSDIFSIFEGKELEVINLVKDAYIAHFNGRSSLPHSCFLRFPNDQKNRIIALPAFLGDSYNIAGIKWIASFPDNISKKIPRASSLLILNCMDTGRPIAVMEASIISARRTAASAILAAQKLTLSTPKTFGIIGAGPISYEILRFAHAGLTTLSNVIIFDLNQDRAQEFIDSAKKEFPTLNYRVAFRLDDVLKEADPISFATNTSTPYLENLDLVPTGKTLLHISLRDLSIEAILQARNFTDDIDHACRENTSLELTEKKIGNRDFIAGTLSEVLEGRIPARTKQFETVIFSPFGLGVLDLALAKYAYQESNIKEEGKLISSFV
ncbi:MAG: 2,3-diaminopropionate biosynthesis protein SbnB [Bdellovibrionales bacterium]|nr:2,3-diaminopropionate biosynthesis protein SbnB [Bdellovibrionales bacterium]